MLKSFRKVFCNLFIFVFLFSFLPAQAKNHHKTHQIKPKTSDSKLISVDNLKGNFNNQIKIVFCDIDGTIIPKGYPKGQVPDSVKQAAKKLRDANIPMVLATGRTYPEAREVADVIGIKDSYFVTMQGSEIVDNNMFHRRIDNICCLTASKHW